MNRLFQRGRASHPVLWTLAIVVAAGLIVGGYVVFGPGPTSFAGGTSVPLQDYHDQDPTGVPVALKSADVVARGEYLTRAADCVVCHTAQGGQPFAGDCVVCHTAKDGAPFAGGRAFVLPFGTLYSTNITPDVETGIGSYSDANFLNAVHKGIGRNDMKLYPAMPYASYTYMTDADALAIKAYLFTLRPLHAPAPENTLVFPFNQRALMGVWAAFFNPDKRFEPHTDRSAQWNRGAYLVEAMEHCGECHTPRNLGFALDNRSKFTGAIQAGWRAYNITPDRGSGVGAWSDEELAKALASVDLVVNATSAGLDPKEPPVLPAQLLSPNLLVFDTVYGPGCAKFRSEVETAGARWSDGLGMLLHQGAAAFSLWTRREAPIEIMRDALQSAFSASRR